MCLCSSQGKAYIAKEDIETYKLLIRKKDGTYITPFRYKEVVLGERMVADGNNELPQYEDGFIRIGSGYIHSYLKVIDDKIHVYLLGGWIVLVKCIIPKGTEYYVDAGLKEICSKELVIGDKEEDFEVKRESTSIFASSYTFNYKFKKEFSSEEIGRRTSFYLSYLEERYNELSDELKETIGRVKLEDSNGKVYKVINPLEGFDRVSVEDLELIKENLIDNLISKEIRIGLTYNYDEDYVYIPDWTSFKNLSEEDVVEEKGWKRVVNLKELRDISKVIDILNCILELYVPWRNDRFLYDRYHYVEGGDVYYMNNLTNKYTGMFPVVIALYVRKD